MGLTVFLIVLGFFQVFWIRNKIKSLVNDSYKTKVNIRSEVTQNATLTNRLQVYGLIVDCKATTALNNTNTNVFDQVYSFVAPRSFSMSHVCNSGVKSFNVNANKVGFLVVKENEGADSLRDDVMNQRVQYVMVQNQRFLIKYEQDIGYKEFLVAVEKLNIPQLVSIENRIVFFLYATSSSHNTFVSPQADTTCRIDVKSFYGITPTTDDQSKAINVQTVVGYTTEAEVPIHILAYRIM
jgi:hypothetical protein